MGIGFRVGIQEELDVLQVARHCRLLEQRDLRWGLRSLLCSDRREWDRFDALYEAYWYTANRTSRLQPAQGGRLDTRGAQDGGMDGARAVETDRAQTGATDTRAGASPREVTGQTDFRFLTDARPLREMEDLVERLARRMRRRLTRRQRHTIRNNLRYASTPLELVFLQRRRQLPRLLLLVDVSRSMSLYSYLFLRFARGLVAAFGEADAFVFHTRLVQVTEALRERDIHKVKQKLAVLSAGWSGGTRIGECLEAFNRSRAGRLLNSRTLVMIMSDGFDTGTPASLATQLHRIKRRARRIIWLNPLLGRDGYAPLAGGMQAVLPSIDLFAPAHNLESLRALESQLVSL
jgi:uncharacterized protein with von Willebrand factor type A (vWA) domain